MPELYNNISASAMSNVLSDGPRPYNPQELRLRQEIDRLRYEEFKVTAVAADGNSVLGQLTTYNVPKEQRVNMLTLFKVYVTDRIKIASDPLGATEEFNIPAATKEEATAAALISLGVAIADLSDLHVHTTVICQVPGAPVEKPSAA